MGHRRVLAAAVLFSLTILIFPSAAFAQTSSSVTTENSVVFGGYSGFVSTGSITNISAKWNVPPATCPVSATQREALQVVEAVSPTGKVYFAIVTGDLCKRYSAYTFVLSPEFVFGTIDGLTGTVQTSMVVNQGDNMSGSISANATTNKVVWVVSDVTRHETSNFTAVVPGASIVNNAFWMVQGPYSCSPKKCKIALAQFTAPVEFSGCTFAWSGKTLSLSHLPSLTKDTLIDGAAQVMAKTSGLSHGTAFSVTYVRST